jgi:3-oxoacyl-[acyl-carrier protein] reductase
MVTGAAGVMGLAVAKAFLSDGASVALADLDGAKLDRIVGGLGANARAIRVDVSDFDQAQAAVRKIEDDLGPIDILVNNAGILTNTKAEGTTPSEWHKVLSVNLDGAFYLAKLVLPGMKARRWGRIVNTCSLAAKSGGITAGTAYSTSKGALQSLTFSLAREVAAFGVTVNGISPAHVNTPMVTEQLNEEQRQRVLAQIPVGRFCEPEEFAHCVRFLAHDLSGFITGEILDLNGGLHFD